MGSEIVVSGGFDPLHSGHLSMFRDAAEWGPLTVLINNDHWLKRKKGFVLVPMDVRREIIRTLPMVNMTQVSMHEAPKYMSQEVDMSVVGSLKRYEPSYFGNGGDRDQDNTPEREFCKQNGIELVYGLGDDKEYSSSDLFFDAVSQFMENQKKEKFQ